MKRINQLIRDSVRMYFAPLVETFKALRKWISRSWK